MKVFLKIVCLLLPLCLLSFNGFSQVNTKYKQTLKKVFVVSGTEDLSKDAINQQFSLYKEQHPHINESVWVKLEEEVLAGSLDNLVALLAPIYQKHLSIKELEEIIQFYESPVGKKFSKLYLPMHQNLYKIEPFGV